MSSAVALDQTVASLVRRSRAGDQNATAMITRVGEEARKGNPKASQTAAAIRQFIEGNPAQDFVLGGEPALVMDPPANDSTAIVPVKPTRAEMERKKPVLPRGIFDRLFDPEHTAVTIVRACGYRNGLPAAAAALASGPPLTNNVVAQFGAENFGSEESTTLFFYGLRFSGDEDWEEVARHFDMPLRRCLAIGQCFGRARKLQAIRQRGSSISAYAPVAGWELGE